MNKQKKKRNNVSGGSATGGGMNFQAAASAFVSVHILDGTALCWLEGLLIDIPVSISVETGGAGDDISLMYTDGSIVEVQVKKGLTKSNRLWGPLINLSHAINNQEITYGLLVICPESSKTIRADLSKDIIRIGEGRSDNLKSISKEFLDMLLEQGIPDQKICKKLRIVVLHALTADSTSINLAKSKLASFCGSYGMATHAWSHLYKDATRLIEHRGQSDISSLLKILSSNNIKLADPDSNSSPVILFNKLHKWSKSAYSHFSIFGINKPLALDNSWIPIKTIVQDNNASEAEDILDALKKYHSWEEKATSREAIDVDPTTLGLYFKHCVVVAGPGMGKTILLQKLFRVYNQRYQPAIFIRLPTLATRMEQSGASFEESIFSIGLDGSGISFNNAFQLNFRQWTFFLDGLDECGHHQEAICQSILNYISSHPNSRLIITTRPVGYHTTLLSKWRHYEILSLDRFEALNNIEILLLSQFKDDNKKLESILKFVKTELDDSEFSNVLLRSPLLLGLTTSLAIRKIELGKTKVDLFKNLFKLIEDSPTQGHMNFEVTPSELNFFLNCLCWNLIKQPTEDIDSILENISKLLKDELNCTMLQAKSKSDCCLKHWEKTGVVERIHHTQGCFLTFIHKTFGEYSAGKYLTGLPVNVINSEIEGVDQGQPLEEVLIFAGSLGAANSIAEILLKKWHSDPANYSTLDLLLDLTISSELPPDKEIRKEIFKITTAEILSLDRNHAYKYASKLIQACGKFSTEACVFKNKHQNHHQYWTRLSCLTLSLIGNVYDKDTKHLIDFFLEFHQDKFFYAENSLDNTFIFGNLCWHNVRDSFIVNAVKVMIDNCDKDELEIIFSKSVFGNKNYTMSLTSDLDDIFTTKGFREFSKRLYKPISAMNILARFNRPELKKREIEATKALCALLININVNKDNRSNSNTLLDISAFLSATIYWNTSYQDLFKLPDSSYHEAISEVFKSIWLASKISEVGLSSDAQSLLDDIRMSSDEDASDKLFNRTTKIDVIPDWNIIKTADINLQLIEDAMCCEIQWIVWTAGNLLVQVKDKNTLLASIKRLLNNDSNSTLRITSLMLSYLDDGPLIKRLIINRLNKKLVSGCQYLYQPLSEVITKLDKGVIDVFKKGLSGSDPITAQEAANLAIKFPDPENKEIYSALSEAYEFWIENEEPYPAEGGAVPQSPREAILSAMIKINQPTYQEIICYLKDSRTDVNKVAKKELFKILEKDSLVCNRFINDIDAQAIDPKYLAAAIYNIRFNQQQILKICELLNHIEYKVRFAAFKVLKSDYITDKIRNKWINIAKRDKFPEIQEAAMLMHSQL